MSADVSEAVRDAVAMCTELRDYAARMKTGTQNTPGANYYHRQFSAMETCLAALQEGSGALPASPSGGQWQPIETAPRDGTVIDAWRAEGGRTEVFWGLPHHECGEMGQYCDSDWHSIRAPGWVCNHFNEMLGRSFNPFTHWMPLPDAPAMGMEARQSRNAPQPSPEPRDREEG